MEMQKLFLLRENGNIKLMLISHKMPAYPRNRSAIYANYPSVLFNGMINPLIPFAIKGAIWYQGESNVYDAKLYGQIFPAMVKCWRSFGIRVTSHSIMFR